MAYVKPFAKEQVTMRIDQYLAELSKMDSIIEALRYTALLRCDNAINDTVFIHLVRQMFINDNYEDWLADPRSIKALAELICQRRQHE